MLNWRKTNATDNATKLRRREIGMAAWFRVAFLILALSRLRRVASANKL